MQSETPTDEPQRAGLLETAAPVRMFDFVRDRVLLFCCVFGTIFSLAFIIYPILSSTYDFDRAYNEGWNAYHQIAALNGRLYKNGPYVFTNYTPLSFFLVGY